MSPRTALAQSVLDFPLSHNDDRGPFMTRHQPLLAPLALACAALLSAGLPLAAQAQSTATITGLIDLSIGSTKAPGGVATKGVDSGKMSTSWWGLRGSEDLGGGLSALYAIEAFMRNDTGSSGRFDGDAFWARNSYVGIAGTSWGKVTIGRNTTPLFVSTLVFNPFGDSFGFSPAIRHYFTSGTVTGDTGWSDSVQYSSPNMSGLSVNLIGALSESKGGRNVGGNLMYFSGPLGVTFAFQDVKKDGAAFAVDDSVTWQLGASYAAIDKLKLFGQIGNVENKTAPRKNKYDIVGFGATYDLLPEGKVLAYYSQLKPDTGNKRTTFSVGYDHFLSKRTDAYGVVMSDKISSIGSSTSYGVGVRHRF
jgi:predicted porin